MQNGNNPQVDPRNGKAQAADPSASDGVIAQSSDSSSTLSIWSAIRPVAAAESRTNHQPGDQMGRWELKEPIGAGGMGEVWSAERAIDGEVMIGALKILFCRKRAVSFQQEVKHLSELAGHPNVVRLLDGDVIPNEDPDLTERFLVMEFVQGMAITDWVKEHGLTTTEQIALFMQLLDALHWMHEKKRVHRDLKPGNIWVTQTDPPRVKVLDFGLATGADQNDDIFSTRCTRAYASPEQRQHRGPLTLASDLYSAGIVLKEMLTGRRPSAQELPSVLPSDFEDSHLAGKDDHTREFSGDLYAIIAKALAECPEDRYLLALDFKTDLENYLKHEPVSVVPSTNGYRLRKFRRREPEAFKNAVWIGVVAVCFLLAALFAMASRQSAEQRAEALAGVTGFVLESSVDALEKIPGTLSVRDSMVRTVQVAIANLGMGFFGTPSDSLRLAAVRSHIKLANQSARKRGRTDEERALALGHLDDAVNLLSVFKGESASADVQSLFAETIETRVAWVGVPEGIELLLRASDIRRDLVRKSNGKVDACRRLAHILDLLGNTLLDSGSEVDGTARVEEASRIREQLVREHPADAETLLQLARASASKARMESAALNNQAALLHYVEADRLYRQALEKDTRPDWEVSRAALYENQAYEFATRGLYDPAIEAAMKALVISRKLVRDNPDDVTFVIGLARALNGLADLQERVSDFEGSDNLLEESTACLKGLQSSKRSGPEDTFFLGEASLISAHVLEARKNYRQALAKYDEANQYFIDYSKSSRRSDLALFWRARAVDGAANARWRLGLETRVDPPSVALLMSLSSEVKRSTYWFEVGSRLTLADAQIRSNHPREALLGAIKAESIMTTQLAKYETKAQFWYWKAVALSLQSQAQGRLRQPAPALKLASEARNAVVKGLAIDPGDKDIQALVLIAESELGEAAAKHGKQNEAEAAWLRIGERLRQADKATILRMFRGNSTSPEYLFLAMASSFLRSENAVPGAAANSSFSVNTWRTVLRRNRGNPAAQLGLLVALTGRAGQELEHAAPEVSPDVLQNVAAGLSSRRMSNIDPLPPAQSKGEFLKPWNPLANGAVVDNKLAASNRVHFVRFQATLDEAEALGLELSKTTKNPAVRSLLDCIRLSHALLRFETGDSQRAAENVRNHIQEVRGSGAPSMVFRAGALIVLREYESVDLSSESDDAAMVDVAKALGDLVRTREVEAKIEASRMSHVLSQMLSQDLSAPMLPVRLLEAVAMNRLARAYFLTEGAQRVTVVRRAGEALLALQAAAQLPKAGLLQNKPDYDAFLASTIAHCQNYES